jgi:hypothetical protein
MCLVLIVAPLAPRLSSLLVSPPSSSAVAPVPSPCCPFSPSSSLRSSWHSGSPSGRLGSAMFVIHAGFTRPPPSSSASGPSCLVLGRRHRFCMFHAPSPPSPFFPLSRSLGWRLPLLFEPFFARSSSPHSFSLSVHLYFLRFFLVLLRLRSWLHQLLCRSLLLLYLSPACACAVPSSFRQAPVLLGGFVYDLGAFCAGIWGVVAVAVAVAASSVRSPLCYTTQAAAATAAAPLPTTPPIAVPTAAAAAVVVDDGRVPNSEMYCSFTAL